MLEWETLGREEAGFTLGWNVQFKRNITTNQREPKQT